MALDGIVISSIVNEIEKKALGGRIDKIYQPEGDEIIIMLRSLGSNHKLLLSANSSNPRLHFTSQSKNNPIQAPNFCMVLRKHLSGGKIASIVQPQFERIVQINIDCVNEMGDFVTKTLIIEIMGKHSNIILTGDNDVIIDSIKRISHDKSSVREVLPGKPYFFPPSKDKLDPTRLEKDSFELFLKNKTGTKIQNIIYQSYNGISPVVASELCERAGVSGSSFPEQLEPGAASALFTHFDTMMNGVREKAFNCEIIYGADGKPTDFSSVDMSVFSGSEKKYFESPSEMLEAFYAERDETYRAAQKTSDLKRHVQMNIERCVKKKEMQLKTLEDIAERDVYKVYGELITAGIYSITKGMTTYRTVNFYEETCPEIDVPLDSSLTPAENAQRYFKRYNKEKRTFAAIQEQMKQNDAEMEYLDGVLSALSLVSLESDINEIRLELIEEGYLKRGKLKHNERPAKTKPHHYVSSDGFDIYVGKNNKQNDDLTLKFAGNGDMWLHTKVIPGSHVIIKSGNAEIPPSTLQEAFMLAAFYSKGKNGSQVPVDYTPRKNVKKPNGAKPGFVIYDNYKTAYVTPDEGFIAAIKKAD